MNKEINEKLNSGLYQCKLDETLTSVVRLLKNATSEATVASIFETELYYLLRNFFGRKIVFHKEAGEAYLLHKFSGRMDAVSNNLIIEYKAIDKLRTSKEQEKAIKQVIDYLTQIHIEEETSPQAILTNGIKLCYFYFIGDDIKQTPFREMSISDLDRIVQSLLNVGTKQFVPRNIVSDFKLVSSIGTTSNLLHALYKTIKENKTTKTEMLFQEWEVLFRLSENDKGQNLDINKRRRALEQIFGDKIENNFDDYQALFILQTAYAIIVKLIACKVISKLAFDDDIKYFSDLSNVSSLKLQEFSVNLEDGYVFATGGIRNLLEGDFFSWYADANQWTAEIFSAIISLITVLDDYSSSTFTYEFEAIDIFKDLYLEIMPNEVRHSLGEYFTPAWLADQVVRSTIDQLPEDRKNTWTAIDPCCGSGIFIVSLIKIIEEQYDLFALTIEGKQMILNDILKRVQGIDINPLSVLTARISYLLAVLPLVDSQKFEIPIYLGDSADIPQTEHIEGVECYKYLVSTKQGNINVILPTIFVDNPSFFEQMSRLQTIIKAEDSKLMYDQLISYIGGETLPAGLKKTINEFSHLLVELHENEWDGIWIRIVCNFMLIARVKNKDVIIGNPPWVKWEYLPQNYAEKIKSLCIDRKIFSGQSYMGAISLNLCALIANVTASRWLRENGILAFLMPKTIMTQDSYAGFRNFFINDEERLYLQLIDDWSNAGNPFIITQEKFMTYYFSHKYQDYSQGIPVRIYEKKKRVNIKDINWEGRFSKVEKHFPLNEGMAYQLDKDRTGFTMISERNYERIKQFKKIIGVCDYKARSGVEFTPAEVYFVEPIEPVSGELGTYFFKNSKFQNSIYKASIHRRFELEVEHVYPVVKAPTIKAFQIQTNNNYCIFPYFWGDRESIKLGELIKKNQALANYLIGYNDLIRKQSSRSRMISMGDDFYALSKVGMYTFSPYKVTFRDNTKLDASLVFPILTPWGEQKKPICAKHSPYISKDKKGRDITEDEAYYLAAILNSNVVGDYFKYTYSTRSYSINFNIKLPKYNEKNQYHKEICELGKKATNYVQQDISIQSLLLLIDKAYLALCNTIDY